MTREEGFRLITRALVFCCLAWCVSNVLFMPTDILGVVHHVHGLRLARDAGRAIYVEDEVHWLRYYVSLTAARAALIAINVWAALWLYHGAAGVRRFFFSAASLVDIDDQD
jgi:hypothetical protein